MASSGKDGQLQKVSGSNHSLVKPNELRSASSPSSSSELAPSELSVLSLVLVDAPTRHDIGALLQCRATNIDAQKPIIRMMKLDVNLRPTKAVIVDMNGESMVAGSTVFVTCLSWGSRPAAKIRWLLRDRPLLDVKESVFESNSTTKSTVRLVLSALDNGAHLRCIAENGNSVAAANSANGGASIASSSIEKKQSTMVAVDSSASSSSSASPGSSGSASTHHQRHHQQQQSMSNIVAAVNNNNNPMAAFDQITLLVKFLPNVSIEAVNAEPVHQTPPTSISQTPAMSTKLGSSSRHQPPATVYSLKEGATLTLNCHVESNPEPFRIRWLHNRREIQVTTTSSNVGSSHTGPSLTHHNRTLMIKGVSRSAEGRYQCAVYNALGRGDSKEIGVYVLRAPRCALGPSPSLTSIESSLQYPTNLFCQVDANPVDGVAIFWQTPAGLVLSKDGRIVRRKSSQHIPSSSAGNSLDEFDPETEEEDEEDENGEDQPEEGGGGNFHPGGRRLSRLLVASKGVRSRLTIVPQSSGDFGLYRCWAENAIGSSRHQDPCVFNLTAKMPSEMSKGANFALLPPRPVHHCATNYTAAILSVRCLHSNFVANQTTTRSPSPSSNHLLQFHLEVHQQKNGDGDKQFFLVANQTNPLEPTFLVANLQPASTYQITVYVSSPGPSSSNGVAVSDKVTMLFETTTTTTTTATHHSNASSNISSSSLVLSSSKSSNNNNNNNNNNFDDWLQGGTAFLPTNYGLGGGGGGDEEVSSSEVNTFDLERMENGGHQVSTAGAGGSSSGDQWSPISKPDLQKQNRLGMTDQTDSGNGNHRLLVILITVLASSFIVFSVLVSVAIGLCLYRNNQQHNSGARVNNSNGSKTPSTSSVNNVGERVSGAEQNNTNSSKTGTPAKAAGNNCFQEFNGGSPVSKICTYDNHHHHHPHQHRLSISNTTSNTTPDLIPCDGGSNGGGNGPHLLIFNASDLSSNASATFQGNNTVAAVTNSHLSATAVPSGTAIYRDFVSLESSDYTVSSDASGGAGGPGGSFHHFQQQQQSLPQQGAITLHTLDALSIGHQDGLPPSSIEPKFLCQPNHVSVLGQSGGETHLNHHPHPNQNQFSNHPHHHPYISGQGNVQLLASSSDSSTSAALLHSSSPFHLLTTANAFLSIASPAAANGNNNNNGTLGHYQHYRNPSSNHQTNFSQSQLLFMGGSGGAEANDGNSSFSLSESPSDHASYQHQQNMNQNHHQLSTFASAGLENPLGGNVSSAGGSSVPTTTVTTAEGDIIQATTV